MYTSVSILYLEIYYKNFISNTLKICYVICIEKSVYFKINIELNESNALRELLKNLTSPIGPCGFEMEPVRYIAERIKD